MKFVVYTNSVSPHQLPVARRLAESFGVDDFSYIYTDRGVVSIDRCALGWQDQTAPFLIHVLDKRAIDVLRGCDVLLSGIRDLRLFKSRLARKKRTFYMSERWLKPPLGMLRLLHPQYFKMARQLVKLMRSEATFVYLPIGIHAARDMARLCGLFSGDLRCLFRAPELDFERKPCGRIYLSSSFPQFPATIAAKSKRYCLDKMRMWGYFVEPSRLTHSQLTNSPTPNSSTLRVLWVGRLLKLKRVDTIIRAVGEIAKSQSPSNSNSNLNFHIQLDIYGIGPEEGRLKKLAAKYGDNIKFYPPVPINEVRKLMREHDIYVLASNGYEGWGAVVSEALEEGIKVIGTYEAGSSATILPRSNLFHAGDWRKLREMLESNVPRGGISGWHAKNAAASLQQGLIAQ